MKVAGIIAEYNPLHEGHIHHLNECRRLTGCDYLVVVMSGDFVQRGMPAVFDSAFRAEMAIRAGADLVLELPLWASTSSAEGFATGGVRLLKSLKLPDTISFGMEVPANSTKEDTFEALTAVVPYLAEEPTEFRSALQAGLRQGLSFPQARSKALASICPEATELLETPNNILAIEYLKAIHRLSVDLNVVPVERVGHGYHDTLPGEFCSASAIREALYTTVLPDAGIPSKLRPFYESRLTEQNGRVLSTDDFSAALFYVLEQLTHDGLITYADVSDALAKRILNERAHCFRITELAEKVKTRDITRTAVDRALCHILLSMKQSDMDLYRSLDTEPYAKVLACRKSALPLLGELSKCSATPLIVRAATDPKKLSATASALYRAESNAAALYRRTLHQATGFLLPEEAKMPFAPLA